MHLLPPPDLFLFAQSLRQSVRNDNPIFQSLGFARGIRYGLKVKTMAGMAACSKSHVGRMLLLLRLPSPYIIAVAEGAPYTPLIRALRSGETLPKVPLPDSIFTLPGS